MWNRFWSWVFPGRAVRQALWALNDKAMINFYLLEQGFIMPSYDPTKESRGRICPVALYLKAATGHDVSVTAGMAFGTDIDVSMPPKVRRFIEEFDRGYYPHLNAAFYRA